MSGEAPGRLKVAVVRAVREKGYGLKKVSPEGESGVIFPSSLTKLPSAVPSHDVLTRMMFREPPKFPASLFGSIDTVLLIVMMVAMMMMIAINRLQTKSPVICTRGWKRVARIGYCIIPPIVRVGVEE